MLPWIKDVTISQVKQPSTKINTKSDNLKNVKHIIAVSSCKGGVGKSTIATNIALKLAENSNLKIGLLDADVYGPSLPNLIPINNPIIKRSKINDKFIEPLIGPNGLKMISFGHVNSKAVTGAGGKQAAIMRGPIVSKVINQLITQTEWNDLDYLIIDFPPG